MKPNWWVLESRTSSPVKIPRTKNRGTPASEKTLSLRRSADMPAELFGSDGRERKCGSGGD